MFLIRVWYEKKMKQIPLVSDATFVAKFIGYKLGNKPFNKVINNVFSNVVFHHVGISWIIGSYKELNFDA